MTVERAIILHTLLLLGKYLNSHLSGFRDCSKSSLPSEGLFHMSYSLNSLRGGRVISWIGVIKGDTRSLGHGSYCPRSCFHTFAKHPEAR